MSEHYIIGDKIDLATLPNHTYVFPLGASPAGFRLYGNSWTVNHGAVINFEYVVVATGRNVLMQILYNPIPIGGYKDVKNIAPYFTDEYTAQRISYNEHDLDLWKPMISTLTEDLATYVTERIDKVTLSGETEIKFDPAYPFYAVKGEDVTATLIADVAEGETAGVYSTNDGSGYTIIKNPMLKSSLYLNGLGDVRVWGGEKPETCPFV